MDRNTRELGYIHALSSSHRQAIETAVRCGCFGCLSIFKPEEINDWVDAVDGVARTALCPRCGVDAVLPAGPILVVDVELLIQMEAHYFGMLDESKRSAARRTAGW